MTGHGVADDGDRMRVIVDPYLAPGDHYIFGDTMPDTRWNGEPCEARRCVVLLPEHDPDHAQDPPMAWWAPFAGTERAAVEVRYSGRTFYLDDQGYTRTEDERRFLEQRIKAMERDPAADRDTFKRAIATLRGSLARDEVGYPGHGWDKVTKGGGSPNVGHSSLPARCAVVRYLDD